MVMVWRGEYPAAFTADYKLFVMAWRSEYFAAFIADYKLYGYGVER